MKCPAKEVWNGDYKCINIDCERNIPANVVEKQFTHPTYRVCSSCKNRDSIRWKCIGCDGVINSNTKRVGSFYCSVVCVAHSNHKRTYISKVKVINPKKINQCVYCDKVIIHNRKLKFCDRNCYSKNRMLEKHRLLLKTAIELRSQIRFKINNPHRSESSRLNVKQYQFRYRNIKRLVSKINNRETHI